MMNKMSNFRRIEKSNEAVAELIPVEQRVELTGSPKQIAWAKDLRHKFICKAMDVAEYEVEFELYKPRPRRSGGSTTASTLKWSTAPP